MNPRNIISNIIMIFNINSTRGHTGSLLVIIVSLGSTAIVLRTRG